VRKLSKILVYTVGALIYIYVSTSLWVFHGPFTAVKEYVIESLAITRHAYLLRPLSLFTLSNNVIDKYSIDWTKSTNVSSTRADKNFRSSNDESPPLFYTAT
jgi:hypothetical protein